MNIDHPYLSLRTFRKSGAAVDTPVWFVADSPKQLYLFSASDAGKVKRIRNSSNAQAAECDMRGGSTGTFEDCSALIVTDAQEIDKAYRLLTRKYGWQMRITNFFSRLSGRINNRTVIRLDLP